MIGKSGERGSGISVLAARHVDDDDTIYITISESHWQHGVLYCVSPYTPIIFHSWQVL